MLPYILFTINWYVACGAQQKLHSLLVSLFDSCFKTNIKIGYYAALDGQFNVKELSEYTLTTAQTRLSLL